jgi:hypothetical protein
MFPYLLPLPNPLIPLPFNYNGRRKHRFDPITVRSCRICNSVFSYELGLCRIVFLYLKFRMLVMGSEISVLSLMIDS